MSHQCHERPGFEIMMVGYPHAVFRCAECHSVIRIIPIDDLQGADSELAYSMLRSYWQARKKG